MSKRVLWATAEVPACISVKYFIVWTQHHFTPSVHGHACCSLTWLFCTVVIAYYFSAWMHAFIPRIANDGYDSASVFRSRPSNLYSHQQCRDHHLSSPTLRMAQAVLGCSHSCFWHICGYVMGSHFRFNFHFSDGWWARAPFHVLVVHSG